MRPILLSMLALLGLFMGGWGANPAPGAQARTEDMANRPPVGAAPAVCNPILREDFESHTLGQFVTSMTDPDAYWAVVSFGHASSCCSAEAWGGEICCAESVPGKAVPEEVAPAGPATGAAPNAPPFEELLTTRYAFTIPATASSATLSFWWQSLFYPPYTWLRVEMSSDGGATWAGLWVVDSTSPNWTQTTLDVTAYRGVPALLRFHFYGSINYTDYWFHVDDIVLDANTPVCPSPTPTATPGTPTVTPTPTYAVPPGHYEDVRLFDTFFADIECLTYRGIVGGYPCGGPGEPCSPVSKPYYRPNTNVTRGQVSKMVASAAGWPDPVPSTQWTFQDVPPGSTFWLWVEQLAAHGAVAGYPCGGSVEPCVGPQNRPYFRVNTTLTRGQLAKIVAVGAGFTETPFSQTFEDVPPGSTFALWVDRIASRNIISGYPCGGVGEPCVGPTNRPYYRPNTNVTRGQTAKIIAKSFFYQCAVIASPTPYIPPASATATVTTTPTAPPPSTTPTVTTTPTTPPATPTVTATPTQ